MNRERIRKVAANVALVLVFGVVAFAIGELGVRILYKDEVSLFPRYHTDAQYGEFKLRKIRPNSVFWHTSVDGSWKFETNAQGFRNREDFSYAKPDGVVRVISLGDSHTQGYEVRQDFTFSAVVEKYLDTRGYDAEVLNTGVSGFSTTEELLFLENEGIKYDPDVVIVGFYANDFEDNIKAGLLRLEEDGTLSVAKKQHVPGVRIQNLIYSFPMVAWLGENSYFYSVLFNSVWEFFKARLASNAAEAVQEYAVPTTEKNSNYEVELTAALLTRMHEFCAQRGIQLIILDIPRVSGNPSVPAQMRHQVVASSDAYVDGSALLADYAGATDLHVPHGAQHISEFSHIVLGVAAAEQIDSWLRQTPGLRQTQGH